jgi:hypothetical protein
MDEMKHESMKHESLEEHIRKHVAFPATKAQILTSCLTEGFSAEEAELANSHLQDKSYASVEEAMETLHHMHK